MEKLHLTQRHIHSQERLGASPREGQDLESGLGNLETPLGFLSVQG